MAVCAVFEKSGRRESFPAVLAQGGREKKLAFRHSHRAQCAQDGKLPRCELDDSRLAIHSICIEPLPTMLGLFARLSLQNNIVHSFLLLLLAFPPRFHSLPSFSLLCVALSRRSYASQILRVLVSPPSTTAGRFEHVTMKTTTPLLHFVYFFRLLLRCCSQRVGSANTEGRRITSRGRYLEPRSRPRYSPLKISSLATFWKNREVWMTRHGNVASLHRTISSFGGEIFH